jgi:O-antigen/teichoic acid export membrane protein
LWAYARYSIPSGYLGKLYNEFDILLIRALVGDGATGLYGVALRVSKPGQELTHLITDGIHSRISTLDSEGRAVGQTVTDALSFASLFTLPAFVGGTLLREEVVLTLFAAKNAGAATLLPGLMAFQLLRSQSSPLGTAIEAVDRPKLKTQIVAVTLVVNVVFGVVLVLQYGTAVGVVVATVFAEAVRYGLAAFALRREVPGVEFLPRPLVAQVLAAGVMGAVTVLLRETVPVESWYALVAHVVVGATTYFLVLAALNRQFRRTLLGAVDAVVPWRGRLKR